MAAWKSVRRALAFLIVAACSFACAVRGAEGPAVVRQIGPFALRDIEGKAVTRDAWRASKAVLLFFVGAECPVSNGYAPLMQRAAVKYARQGVACYAVHCDPTMTAEAAARHAREYGLGFCVVLDPAQALAAPAGVRVTPEAVVVSPAGKVLYRGRIDNRYAPDGKRRDEPTARDLETALDAVLSGARPAVSETEAFGCPLPKPKPGS